MLNFPKELLSNCTIKTHDSLDGTTNYAIYSDCQKYRYILHRTWNETKDPLVMIMLNPSTATEVQNDPTVERCHRRALEHGFGGMIVLNIFAYRATDPKVMRAQDDPVGPYNDQFISDVIKSYHSSDNVVCGWGTHGEFMNRHDHVMNLFLNQNIEPLGFKWTKNGYPQHPLYIAYKELPKARA